MDLVFKKSITSELSFEIWNEKPTHLDLFTVNQIHSNITINANLESIDTDADGITSSRADLILAIKTADCVPIGIIGTKGIALVHAGWKGIRDEILLSENIREIDPTQAIIGPHIRVESYEVGEDFKKNFPNSKHFEEINEKVCFNLTSATIEQLSLAYPSITIEDCKLDTYKEHYLRSYRRGDKIKRNWNILKYN